MKHLKSLMLALICVCLLASCTTVQKTASTVEVQTNVWQYPMVADLDISPEKITSTVSWSGIFSTMGRETRQSNLIAEMLMEANADVLVEPQAVYSKKFPSSHTLTVTGFPAKFVNFRKATERDLEALKVGNPDICLVSDPVGPPRKKTVPRKKRFLFF